MTDHHTFFRDISIGVGGPIIGILGNAVLSDPYLKTASLGLGAFAALLTCVVKIVELYQKFRKQNK
jgi:hypothetical protein